MKKRVSGLGIYQDLINSQDRIKVSKSVSNDQEQLHLAVRQQGFGNYEGDGWIIIMGVDPNIIFSRLNDLAIKAIIIGVVMFLLAIPFALFISSTITRPLRLLQSSADAISQGDYSKKLRSKARMKYQKLGHHFKLCRKKYMMQLLI